MTLDVPERQTIDEGIYNATLTKLEVKTIEKGAYAGDTIRIWTFHVDVDGVPESVTASSSLAFGPKSKAYSWFTAIMGRAPVFGEKGVQITGRPCRVWLTIDDESGYNKVKDVLPAEKGQKPVEAITAAPAATDDDLPDMEFPLEEPPQYSKDDLP